MRRPPRNGCGIGCARLLRTLRWLAVPWVAGCTIHTGHTIAPYGREPVKARELEDTAIRECAAHRGGRLPPYSFTTDGCSWWPDSVWKDCCVTHDRAYWCGGSFDDRVAADRALQDCVAHSGHPVVAALMRAGVFVGGARMLPTSFRWGYGWPYPCGGASE